MPCWCRSGAATAGPAWSEAGTSGSALLEEIDELLRSRSSYIAANWPLGHALL